MVFMCYLPLIRNNKTMLFLAKILCLGSLESKNEEKRNSAISIVSQILLDSSPKRKRRCRETKNSPIKENILMPASVETDTENLVKEVDIAAINDVIPETMTHFPLKPITNLASVNISPSKKNGQISQTSTRFSSSINLPIQRSTSPRIESVKKNLSADCIPQENCVDIIEYSPPTKAKKGLLFNIDLKTVAPSSSKACSDTTMDATLLEYVKDSRTELDKIWFDEDKEEDETDLKQKNTSRLVNEELLHASPDNHIVEETPIREENKTFEKRRRADFWLLKEKRELNGCAKSLDGKKLKQTKLELGIKRKPVDISKLAGFTEGIQQLSQQFGQDKDDDIIPGSPGSPISELALKENTSNEVHSVEPINFQPIASSTQHSSVKEGLFPVRTTTSKSPGYAYKREAVKKKSERARLPGWECDECRKMHESLSAKLREGNKKAKIVLPMVFGLQHSTKKQLVAARRKIASKKKHGIFFLIFIKLINILCFQYYEAMSLSPSKVKSRMNACSRHRDKFKPNLNDTPP
uniref:Uncharacterized protein n=1 Tax=Rhodnius prolixus TaxID=13249 RepID=T1HU14_RHOPR